MMGTSRSVSPLPSAWALLYHGQLARRRALELLKKSQRSQTPTRIHLQRSWQRTLQRVPRTA